MATTKLFDLMRSGDAGNNHKALARKNVDTYTTESLVVHELLQNSIDAIHKNSSDGGNIQLVLNPESKTVVIEDDGCGFPPDINLLLLGGTDKDSPDASQVFKGNLGVGLKAVYLSSVKFLLRSVSVQGLWTASLSGGHAFEVEEPEITYDDDPQSSTESTGTRIEITFPDDSVAEFINDMVTVASSAVAKTGFTAKWAANKRIDVGIEWFFRTRSYTADTSSLCTNNAPSPIKLDLKIIRPSDPDVLDESFATLFGTSVSGDYDLVVECRHWDVRAFVRNAPRGVSRPRIIDGDVPEGGRIGQYDSSFVWVKSMTNSEDFTSLLKNPGLRSQVDVDKYERLLFGSLRGLYIVIGSRERLRDILFEPPAQFVSVQGVPSFHELQKPTLGGSLGYIANVHIVADINATFNVGKQTVTNPRLIGILNQFFNDAYRATLKNVARAIVGRPHQDLEEDEDAAVDYIALPDLPIDKLGLIKEPQDENAVIGLFFALISRGYLEGYSIYGLTGHDRYDGKFRADYVGDKPRPSPTAISQLHNLEFKIHLKRLIQDFETDSKDPSDINLAIVWDDDLPDHFVAHISKLDLDESRFADRHYHRVSLAIHDNQTNASFQVLVLSDVVKEVSKI